MKLEMDCKAARKATRYYAIDITEGLLSDSLEIENEILRWWQFSNNHPWIDQPASQAQAA